MSKNICQCHCGTRIDLDQQLLEEREMWKQKYLCLQQQVKIDIQNLKDNIYAQCSGIMQNEFLQKQTQHNKIINEKNSQIKDLISRTINLQTQNKVLSKQKELMEHKLRQIEALLSEKEQIINDIKSKGSKNIRDWELKHEQQLTQLKQRLVFQSKEQLQKAQAERQILKQKLKQFQIKYQKILPEIQKMRNCIASKTSENEQLIKTIQKQNKKMGDQNSIFNSKFQDLNRIHNTCAKQIKNLSEQNENMMRQLDRCKKISRQVKVEPVYIDRPIEVPKVVQKIVEVQKLVTKHVGDPNLQKKLKNQEQENKKLRQQINNLLSQLKEVEENYNKVISNLEENIKQHEKNVVLYKKQRQALASKIGQQNKQLDLMHSYVDNMRVTRERPSGGCNCDNQKIVVHVKQDGTYQKTVEKLPTPPPKNVNNQKKKK